MKPNSKEYDVKEAHLYILGYPSKPTGVGLYSSAPASFLRKSWKHSASAEMALGALPQIIERIKSQYEGELTPALKPVPKLLESIQANLSAIEQCINDHNK